MIIHMNYRYVFFALLNAVFFFSCQCEHYQCPSFGDNPLLPPEGNMVFKNALSGEEIKWVREERVVSEIYGEEETVLSFNCKSDDCVSTGKFTANSAASGSRPSMPMQVFIQNNYTGKTKQTEMLNYSVGNMSASFSSVPGPMPRAGLLPAGWHADSVADVNTGTRIYPGVLIHTREGANPYDIVKTYWYKNSGLIGFVFQNGQVFWRD